MNQPPPSPSVQLAAIAKSIRRGLYQGMSTWTSQAVRLLRRVAPRPARRAVLYRVGGLNDGRPRTHVFCASPIGLYREYGTGIYGPRRRRIVSLGEVYTDPKGRVRPRVALRWVSQGREFVRRSVRGAPARPWFWPSLQAAVPRLGPVLVKTVRDHIRRARR